MEQILIIEDNKTQNDVLANFLRKNGYQVFSAYSISEGWKLFSSDIKLIILDLNLPDGSGFDFLEDLRKKSSIPVIVLTAYDDEFTQLNAFELQADEYVEKPVSPLVMTKRIQAFMNRIYPSQSEIRILNFVFDFEKHQVNDNEGQQINLTAKEIKFLKLLFERKGSPVPREQILENIWGFEYRDEVRLLYSHVKNIRKKLSSDVIITVKNIGYRLNL